MTDANINAVLPEISSYYKQKRDGGLREFPKNQWEEAKEKGKVDLAEEEHTLVYDSPSETLEPVYFWLLDLLNNRFPGKVEKITDNFTSSPGSGHFSELMGKATVMQKEAMNIMQTLGVLVKSIINIIYDLREFQIRLSQYKGLMSKNKDESEAARLALKQIWMDQVDIKRGVGSINALTSGNLQFVTLRDAFMAANTLKEVKNIDLNDRVKRILEARLAEYLEWEKRSEKELTKRYSIERAYLKSQVDSLKLYTKWVKPYLKAAAQLQQKETISPEVVTAFNTVLLQLTLLARDELKFSQAVVDKKLPEAFRNKEPKRKYYSIIVLDFKFRGIPQRFGQHYAFGGRVTVNFKAYALNEQEYILFKKKIEDEDMKEALSLAQGMTDDSLKQIEDDIKEFLGEEEKKEQTSSSSNTDPFTALFMPMKKAELTNMPEPEKIKSDSYVEGTVRKLAIKSAKRICFDLFDVYKKAHLMPSHPNPYDEPFIPTED